MMIAHLKNMNTNMDIPMMKTVIIKMMMQRKVIEEKRNSKKLWEKWD
jgi:hypothetical protein